MKQPGYTRLEHQISADLGNEALVASNSGAWQVTVALMEAAERGKIVGRQRSNQLEQWKNGPLVVLGHTIMANEPLVSLCKAENLTLISEGVRDAELPSYMGIIITQQFGHVNQEPWHIFWSNYSDLTRVPGPPNQEVAEEGELARLFFWISCQLLGGKTY